ATSRKQELSADRRHAVINRDGRAAACEFLARHQPGGAPANDDNMKFADICGINHSLKLKNWPATAGEIPLRVPRSRRIRSPTGLGAKPVGPLALGPHLYLGIGEQTTDDGGPTIGGVMQKLQRHRPCVPRLPNSASIGSRSIKASDPDSTIQEI